MKSNFAYIAVTVLCVAPAFSQSLIEHAAAAAGATAGVAGGKMLSNGIDKMLGKAAETGSNAAKVPVSRPSTVPVAPPAPTSMTAPSPLPGSNSPAALPARQSRARRTTNAIDPGKPVFAVPEQPALPVLATPRTPTPEDFSKVKEGSGRSDVLAALGVASSHITIPGDDGHLIEILSYSDAYHRLGSVRMDNGVVVSVNR